MLEFLNNIDTKLFLFLNGAHSGFWDAVMWQVSGRAQWIPLYVFILGLLIYRFRLKALWITIGTIVMIALIDQASVHLFKNVFERLRPCHEPGLEGLVYIVRDSCGGRYGFVSSHAANTFGLTVFTGRFIRNRWYWAGMACWVLLVGYSRIYLGVHYPGDILGGMALGGLFAQGTYLIMISIQRLQLKK